VSAPLQRCPWCHRLLTLIAVHGHGQCAACGNNVEPCCAGASAGDEADELQPGCADADPELFARLFAGLGGARATVTEVSLLHALSNRQGTTLDDARIVLQAALQVGKVREGALRCYRLA